MWREVKALCQDFRKGEPGFIKLILVTGMILKLLTLNKSELPFPSPKVVAIMTHFTAAMWDFCPLSCALPEGLLKNKGLYPPKCCDIFTVQTHLGTLLGTSGSGPA